ncbi:unnamed protein product [Adineta ricciae]|uniref:Uncharacterized protein n=1 Tax=Adineta ricciae TaxID=249248 RepID=A0A815T880_ADIRI|nr:unnamed protein product [Adineta ricciae]
MVSNRILQNFYIICLDSNTNQKDYTHHDKLKQLQNIANIVDTFHDVDNCIDFVTDIKHEKVFLVLSSTFSCYIISLIHDIDGEYDKAKELYRIQYLLIMKNCIFWSNWGHQ